MGGNQEVGQVFGGDVSSDRCVVAGGSGVLENGFVVRGEPQEFEDGTIEISVGGAKVEE